MIVTRFSSDVRALTPKYNLTLPHPTSQIQIQETTQNLTKHHLA